MDTTSADDDHESSFFIPCRIPVFILIYLFACSKPVKETSLTIEKKFIDTNVKAPEPPPVKPAGKKKKIYLTFDDGPNKGTQNVMHIIKDELVPVSFFIVGEHVFASRGQSDVWDSLQMIQHIEICNHSYTHADHNRFEKFYENPDSVVKDFKRTQDSLKLKNNIVRTPGRNIWRIDSIQFTDIKKSKAAADSLQKAGFIVMGWDLEWHFDHKELSVKNTADEMLNQIDSIFKYNKTKSPEHLVLLAHDQAYKKSKDSLELRQLIQKLKLKDDYELAVVTEYPGATN